MSSFKILKCETCNTFCLSIEALNKHYDAWPSHRDENSDDGDGGDCAVKSTATRSSRSSSKLSEKTTVKNAKNAKKEADATSKKIPPSSNKTASDSSPSIKRTARKSMPNVVTSAKFHMIKEQLQCQKLEDSHKRVTVSEAKKQSANKRATAEEKSKPKVSVSPVTRQGKSSQKDDVQLSKRASSATARKTLPAESGIKKQAQQSNEAKSVANENEQTLNASKKPASQKPILETKTKKEAVISKAAEKKQTEKPKRQIKTEAEDVLEKVPTAMTNIFDEITKFTDMKTTDRDSCAIQAKSKPEKAVSKQLAVPAKCEKSRDSTMTTKQTTAEQQKTPATRKKKGAVAKKSRVEEQKPAELDKVELNAEVENVSMNVRKTTRAASMKKQVISPPKTAQNRSSKAAAKVTKMETVETPNVEIQEADSKEDTADPSVSECNDSAEVASDLQVSTGKSINSVLTGTASTNYDDHKPDKNVDTSTNLENISIMEDMKNLVSAIIANIETESSHLTMSTSDLVVSRGSECNDKPRAIASHEVLKDKNVVHDNELMSAVKDSSIIKSLDSPITTKSVKVVLVKLDPRDLPLSACGSFKIASKLSEELETSDETDEDDADSMMNDEMPLIEVAVQNISKSRTRKPVKMPVIGKELSSKKRTKRSMVHDNEDSSDMPCTSSVQSSSIGDTQPKDKTPDLTAVKSFEEDEKFEEDKKLDSIKTEMDMKHEEKAAPEINEPDESSEGMKFNKTEVCETDETVCTETNAEITSEVKFSKDTDCVAAASDRQKSDDEHVDEAADMKVEASSESAEKNINVDETVALVNRTEEMIALEEPTDLIQQNDSKNNSPCQHESETNILNKPSAEEKNVNDHEEISQENEQHSPEQDVTNVISDSNTVCDSKQDTDETTVDVSKTLVSPKQTEECSNSADQHDSKTMVQMDVLSDNAVEEQVEIASETNNSLKEVDDESLENELEDDLKDMSPETIDELSQISEASDKLSDISDADLEELVTINDEYDMVSEEEGFSDLEGLIEGCEMVSEDDGQGLSAEESDSIKKKESSHSKRTDKSEKPTKSTESESAAKSGDKHSDSGHKSSRPLSSKTSKSHNRHSSRKSRSRSRERRRSSRHSSRDRRYHSRDRHRRRRSSSRQRKRSHSPRSRRSRSLDRKSRSSRHEDSHKRSTNKSHHSSSDRSSRTKYIKSGSSSGKECMKKSGEPSSKRQKIEETEEVVVIEETWHVTDELETDDEIMVSDLEIEETDVSAAEELHEDVELNDDDSVVNEVEEIDAIETENEADAEEDNVGDEDGDEDVEEINNEDVDDNKDVDDDVEEVEEVEEDVEEVEDGDVEEVEDDAVEELEDDSQGAVNDNETDENRKDDSSAASYEEIMHEGVKKVDADEKTSQSDDEESIVKVDETVVDKELACEEDNDDDSSGKIEQNDESAVEVTEKGNCLETGGSSAKVEDSSGDADEPDEKGGEVVNADTKPDADEDNGVSGDSETSHMAAITDTDEQHLFNAAVSIERLTFSIVKQWVTDEAVLQAFKTQIKRNIKPHNKIKAFKILKGITGDISQRSEDSGLKTDALEKAKVPGTLNKTKRVKSSVSVVSKSSKITDGKETKPDLGNYKIPKISQKVKEDKQTSSSNEPSLGSKADPDKDLKRKAKLLERKLQKIKEKLLKQKSTSKGSKPSPTTPKKTDDEKESPAAKKSRGERPLREDRKSRRSRSPLRHRRSRSRERAKRSRSREVVRRSRSRDRVRRSRSREPLRRSRSRDRIYHRSRSPDLVYRLTPPKELNKNRCLHLGSQSNEELRKTSPLVVKEIANNNTKPKDVGTAQAIPLRIQARKAKVTKWPNQGGFQTELPLPAPTDWNWQQNYFSHQQDQTGHQWPATGTWPNFPTNFQQNYDQFYGGQPQPPPQDWNSGVTVNQQQYWPPPHSSLLPIMPGFIPESPGNSAQNSVVATTLIADVASNSKIQVLKSASNTGSTGKKQNRPIAPVLKEIKIDPQAPQMDQLRENILQKIASLDPEVLSRMEHMLDAKMKTPPSVNKPGSSTDSGISVRVQEAVNRINMNVTARSAPNYSTRNPSVLKTIPTTNFHSSTNTANKNKPKMGSTIRERVSSPVLHNLHQSYGSGSLQHAGVTSTSGVASRLKPSFGPPEGEMNRLDKSTKSDIAHQLAAVLTVTGNAALSEQVLERLVQQAIESKKGMPTPPQEKQAEPQRPELKKSFSETNPEAYASPSRGDSRFGTEGKSIYARRSDIDPVKTWNQETNIETQRTHFRPSLEHSLSDAFTIGDESLDNRSRMQVDVSDDARNLHGRDNSLQDVDTRVRDFDERFMHPQPANQFEGSVYRSSFPQQVGFHQNDPVAGNVYPLQPSFRSSFGMGGFQEGTGTWK